MPQLWQIRDRLRRAYTDLSAQFDFSSLEQHIADRTAWLFEGLSMEHRRALLMWSARDLTMTRLGQAIDGLVSVAAFRGMVPTELTAAMERIDASLQEMTKHWSDQVQTDRATSPTVTSGEISDEPAEA